MLQVTWLVLITHVVPWAWAVGLGRHYAPLLLCLLRLRRHDSGLLCVFLLFSLQQVPSQNAFRGQQVTFTFEYFVRNKVYIDN